MLQAVDDVLAHAEREEVGRGADVGKRPAGHRLGGARDVDAAELEAARARRHEARQHLRQLARALPADDGDVLVDPDFQRHAVEQAHARIVDQRDAGGAQLARARQLGRRDERLDLRRRHVLGGELLDDLAVLDLYVHALLVPVDQLLHRARQVLVGRDHRDQRADVEAPRDHQIAANRVEEERRHLRQEVVEELHHELALVELEADVEDAAQPRRDLGALVVGGVVRVDLGRAVDALGDSPGEGARGELALAPQHQQALPQLRDDERLDADHAERDQAEREVLVEDEEHRRQRLAAEEQRRDQRLADEAAERLDLVLDHGGHLGGLDAAKARQREAQDVVEEPIAQAPEHALAHPALHGVDLELEPAVEHDQAEEDDRQGEQVGQALEVHAEPVGDRVLLEGVALDRLVDDRLGQVERQVVDDHGRQHQRHDQELVALAVTDDEAEETAVHWALLPCFPPVRL